MHQPQPIQKLRTGFALLSGPELRKLCSKAGKTSQASGKANRFTSAQAREAGRKGGLAAQAKMRAGANG